jgi:vancomycin resistance protein YoaR
MTDLPDPAADDAAAAVTPEGHAPPAGDPELAALVRPRSRPVLEGDASLAALVRLGQRPVSAAIPAPVVAERPEAAAPEPAAASDGSAPDPVDSATSVDDPGIGATDPVDAGPAVDLPSPAGEAEAPAVDASAPDADVSAAGDDTAVAVDLPVAASAALPPATEPTGAPASRRRSLALRFAFAFLLGVALVVGVGAGALYAWGSQYDGRVLPGVHVGGTDLSGLTSEQAQAAIAQAYASLGAGRIVLAGPDGPVAIGYTDIARGPDTAAMLHAALTAGRQGEPLANLVGAPQAAIHGVTVASAVTYDRAKLRAAVDMLAAKIDQAPTDASVAATPGGPFTVSAAKPGREVDKGALLAQLDQRLTALDAPAEISLDIPVRALSPAVSTAAADDAMAAADRMAADLVIARGSDSWTIPSASLQPLISFTPAPDGSISPVLDEAGLDPLVGALATQVNQPVQDAGLALAGDHVVATGTSREGRTLDTAAMKTAIVNHMAARQAGNAVEPLSAVVTAVQPKLSSEAAAADAAQMRVISSYSIYYWVLINNHWGGNIEGPARKINGTVVPAGGTFDFWKAVGDLHQIPDVGPGNAIEGGKITVTGAFGGGICTTSTTLFNAALEAGMKLGARQNHNEFISRYPAGLDATVWIVGSAQQTMSFTNDTPYPILIQSIIQTTGSKRWLTFRIWSVPNGRTYKISNLIIQPGPTAVDTVVEDPTEPVGWSYRVNTPVNGAKVWVTVTIYDHGKLHWSKTYFSNYPAVNGVLQVGTKAVP